MNLEGYIHRFQFFFYPFVMLLSFTGDVKFRICCSLALFQLNTQNKCFICAVGSFGHVFCCLVVYDFGHRDCALQCNYDPSRNLSQR